MRDELRLLKQVTHTLTEGRVKYFVSGSVASMYYGEPRLTQDIDIVVHLKMADISTLIGGIKEPDFYLDPKRIHEAMSLVGQFNAIHHPSGIKIDFMCVELEGYNAVRFERAQLGHIEPDIDFHIAAPEDVILKKLEYFKLGQSDKHLRDIASMIKISGETFDRDYLERWAKTLDVIEEWEAVKSRVNW